MKIGAIFSNFMLILDRATVMENMTLEKKGFLNSR